MPKLCEILREEESAYDMYNISVEDISTVINYFDNLPIYIIYFYYYLDNFARDEVFLCDRSDEFN